MRYTIQQYDTFEKWLKHRGYRKYDQKHRNSDWQFFKTFYVGEKKAYQLAILVYDWRNYPNVPEQKKPIGVMYEFMTCNEFKVDRADFLISDNKYTVPKFEKFCESLYTLIVEKL